MTSKIQQAKNEKLLKELARLSENKRCAICTCMGTQYTCQPPSIFVCSTCAGAMYHFPGFRVKSRSMATYTAAEVQQMKEGGNAAFQRQYLAKWNANSFPAPTEKNPKKVEEFIKQVLVDKVFFSDVPAEATPATEAAKPMAPSAQSSFKQASGQLSDNSWQAFSGELLQVNSGKSSTIATDGNWAEFPTQPAAAQNAVQSQPFDPFASGSPQPASPKSVHSTPADPFAVKGQDQMWEAFQNSPNGAVAQPVVQTGWSQFETQSADAAVPTPVERPNEAPAVTSTLTGGNSKTKAPAMRPLPEEWFSIEATPPPPQQQQQQASQPYLQQDFSAFNPLRQPTYAAVPGYGAGSTNVYQPSSFAPATPQPAPFAFSPQAARASFGGGAPSFRSATGITPQQWPQQQQQPAYVTMQRQDSMASYVSHRVDEASHNLLFQNLDMDMRSKAPKAHSVAGMPIQPTSHALFQNTAAGPFDRSGNSAFQQSFFQTSAPQTGFDETSGNPFA